jgi:hypothetical protein
MREKILRIYSVNIKSVAERTIAQNELPITFETI